MGFYVFLNDPVDEISMNSILWTDSHNEGRRYVGLTF